uniref:helix-turn-helix domain-containing protein n=1 Tax=Lachnoclostridium phocaeense TaxID=1871021 RepID=UPI0026DDBD76|nr:helix-turn-helix transcriptional regulator [Lachnoclostridium phocaeense]
MDVKRTGSFIAEMRKGKNMTQAELAAKLQVTDKAVSRWERGVGYPDITLLEPLAGQLGVTVLDILRGEKTFPDKMTGEETEQTVAETVRLAAGQRRQAVRRVILLAIVMLIGAAMLIWGILWWTSQQSALKIIAGADGPSAVFVAWKVEPMLPVAVSAAGAVLILASLLIYRWRK